MNRQLPIRSRSSSADQLKLTSLESLAGLCAISMFYVGDIFILKLVLQALTILAVGMCVIRDSGQPLGYANNDWRRGTSLMLLTLALGGFLTSSVLAIFARSFSVNDFGVFVVQVGLPIMILLSRARLRLVLAIGFWAVPFALMDAVANSLALAGLVELQFAGRRVGGVLQIAYPGLSGNTLGGGFVAFAACTYLLHLAQSYPRSRVVLLTLFVIILISLYYIAARRYLGLTIVAMLMFQFWRTSKMLGLPMITIVVAALFLWLTFSAADDDGGNVLRGLLMLNGIERALETPFIGNGPTYFDLQDAEPNFLDLSTAGVTESQLLDFAISYGMFAAISFLIAILLALGAQNQARAFLPAVLLTTMGAELFFGGALASFAGTLLFYGSLAACIERKPVNSTSGLGTVKAQ